MQKSRLQITRGQRVTAEELKLARQFRKNPTFDERALWTVLRGDALGGLHFRRQQVIEGFIVDFYCAAAQVAIELDGEVHEGQSMEDTQRDLALTSKGVRTMRITSERVRHELPTVLEEIVAACELT